MKGLLIKDLYALKKQGKVMAALIIFYLAFSIATKNLGLFSSVSISLSILLPITSMSLDEYNKWDTYAVSMPVSRKSIVLSKYILGLGLNITITIIVCIVNFIFVYFGANSNYGDVVATGLNIAGGGVLLLSILLPIIYKFGVEKARLLMLLIFLVPALVFALLPEMDWNINAKPLLYIGPVLLIFILLLSIAISSRIYTGKEF